MNSTRETTKLTSGVDPLTPEQRKLNMSKIRAKDTKPELMIRRALHSMGLRYRLHSAELPGRPDLVFPRYRAVIFVHGCFWHGHDCPMFRLPATRTEFWLKKIEQNRARDLATFGALQRDGWRVLTIWECAVRGPARLGLHEVAQQSRNFIFGSIPNIDFKGAWPSN